MMHDPHALQRWCNAAVAAYLARYPGEVDRLADFRSLLALNVPLADRTTLPGHVTASGVLVDAPGERVLLIRHVVLNRWLSPGGHLEAGELPLAAARREVLEEVGLAVGDSLGTGPLDIDSHPIPANPKRGEPAHTHHDFRFAFAVDPAAARRLDTAEVSASAWVDFDDDRVPPDLRPALAKLSPHT